MFLTSWNVKFSERKQKMTRKMHTYIQTEKIIIDKSVKKIENSLCPREIQSETSLVSPNDR